MTPLKINRAQKLAGIAGMRQTADHVMRNIIDATGQQLDGLTSQQLAAVIAVAQTSYHDGRKSCASEVIDGDCVWIGAGVDKLVPLAALRAIKTQESVEYLPAKPAAGGWSWPKTSLHTTKYSMDYSETV